MNYSTQINCIRNLTMIYVGVILFGVARGQGDHTGGGKQTILAQTHKSLEPVKAANKKRQSSIGFFYFELIPTSPAPKDAPYYFSDVVIITYSSNVDLGHQQDDYIQKLRSKAGSPDNYNQKSSIEKTTFKDAEDERKENIRVLKLTNTVIEKSVT